MGFQLANLVYVRWSHLHHVPFRVLMRMALVALDEAQPGRPADVYFGGLDLLACGLPTWRDGNHPVALLAQDSARRMAKKALKELVKEGAIERLSHAHPGSRQEYRLTLWPT